MTAAVRLAPRLDPAALTAMFAANRIANSLERIASLTNDRRFLLEGEALDDVMGVVSAALHDWIVTIGSAARPADLRAGTARLRVEAARVFEEMRRHGSVSIVAIHAREWADSVKGWAQVSGSLAL